MRRYLNMWVLIVTTGVAVAGCGGGGAEVRSDVRSVSTGQHSSWI